MKVEACCHHWVIEPPNGEKSGAVCKLCGATRDFLNYVWNKSRNYRAPKKVEMPQELRPYDV